MNMEKLNKSKTFQYPTKDETLIIAPIGNEIEYKVNNESTEMEKKITQKTLWETGNLLHTISVECSYHRLEDAHEHNAITFLARTEGEANGEKVNDLDYAIECSIEDARDFANYILSLCDDIESAKR